MSPKDTEWVDASMDTTGDAIVASLAAGGVDHLFFTSGSEIGFYQEAIAKAQANGHNKLVRLVTVPLEHVSLNAALGFAAVSGRPASWFARRSARSISPHAVSDGGQLITTRARPLSFSR